MLRYLENYLGSEKFRDGLQAFLEEHGMSTVTTDDYWTAMSNVSVSNCYNSGVSNRILMLAALVVFRSAYSPHDTKHMAFLICNVIKQICKLLKIGLKYYK